MVTCGELLTTRVLPSGSLCLRNSSSDRRLLAAQNLG